MRNRTMDLRGLREFLVKSRYKIAPSNHVMLRPGNILMLNATHG